MLCAMQHSMPSAMSSPIVAPRTVVFLVMCKGREIPSRRWVILWRRFSPRTSRLGVRRLQGSLSSARWFAGWQKLSDVMVFLGS